MRSFRTLSLCLLVFLFAWAGPASAKDGSLVRNGSFENAVVGSPSKDIGQGVWDLAPDRRLPEGWSLNLAYPGTIRVDESLARTGRRSMRIAARSDRDAQVFQSVPAMRPGTWYRISAHVSQGTAVLLVYEYATGRTVKAHTLASAAGHEGEWKPVVGFYTPDPDAFQSASVALLVPKGGSAVIDDVEIEALDGPVPAARARPIQIETKEVKATISPRGYLTSLVAKATGREHADPSAVVPVLTATYEGVRLPVATIEKKGKSLVARFPYKAVSAKVRFEVENQFVLFEVMEARPKDLEGLALHFPVLALKTQDLWMSGTYEAGFGMCHMGVTPNTRATLTRRGRLVSLDVDWTNRHGIKGGKSAFVAAADYLSAIRAMEVATGLPSPMLHSGAPGETGTTEWARRSTAVKQSYLFATYMAPGDLDALIRYAKLGGFSLIMLHRHTWRATGGHEEIARDVFPGGLPDLAAACEKIHAAGLGVGLHLYGPAITRNDAYATPVPDDRLFTIPLAPLAAGIDAAATELPLERRPRLPQKGAADVYPGNLLRIGDEIVRWRELTSGESPRLVGCERGALGTTASAHKAGADVRSFVLGTGGFLVDPDSTLPEEMGEHLGRVVNACQADLVYFDASLGAPAGREPEAWYYTNRVLIASCAKFDHGVIVQMGTGAGRQLAWHLVPRSASADGHGDLKGYLDKRMPAIKRFRQTHIAADIGWYALDIHGRPDELEYVCAKALAADASVSVQAHKALLESHPRAREVFEMIERWERRRLADDVPVALRGKMLPAGRETRLFEDEQGAWSLWEASYDPARPVGAMDGDANAWTIQNPRGAAAHLALEIERVPVATTPAVHASDASIPIEDFSKADAFSDSDPELEAYVVIGGRRNTAEGMGRRGVTTSLKAAAAAPTGAPSVELVANSTSNGAGWCATGRRLPEPLDLSAARALGLWVHGDGVGESLILTFVDADGEYARLSIPVDFEGWRFKSIEVPLKRIDWTRVTCLLLGLEHIPPRGAVTIQLADLRAVTALHEPKPIEGVEITLGDRTLRLPVAVRPDRCITIDPLGRVLAWPGGMAEGVPVPIEGGPLVLPKGTSRFEIDLDSDADYAGDISVRVCRTWPFSR